MKQRIKNYLLSHFVKVIVPQDVIRDVKGVLYLGKEKVTDQELKVLQAEAKALKSMRLWSILNETPKQIALDRGWKESTTMEHLNTAKTMYSVLEFQESVVNIIRNKVVV
jgi:hypothetical protein